MLLHTKVLLDILRYIYTSYKCKHNTSNTDCPYITKAFRRTPYEEDSPS